MPDAIPSAVWIWTTAGETESTTRTICSWKSPTGLLRLTAGIALTFWPPAQAARMTTAAIAAVSAVLRRRIASTWLGRLDGGDVDHDLHFLADEEAAGLQHLLPGETELVAASADGRDHHVLDLELDARVRRVDVPCPCRHTHDPMLGLQLGRHGRASSLDCLSCSPTRGGGERPWCAPGALSAQSQKPSWTAVDSLGR